MAPSGLGVGMTRIVVDGHQFTVTQHAVTRFHERACPSLPSHAAAAHHLAQLLTTHAVIALDQPDWLADRHVHAPPQHRPADMWLLVGDLVFPIASRHVVTCLCRGHISTVTRRRRNEAKARRRASKAARRRGLGNDRKEAA